MDRQIELDLIKEIIDLKAAQSSFLSHEVTSVVGDVYISDQQFDTERRGLFERFPQVAAHSSELSQVGDFITRDIAGRSLLITRDKAGDVRAFYNACRHRGTKLVDSADGCRRRFTCPYHAWTYANTGVLLSAPHFETGFNGVEKSALSLLAVPCREFAGFIWVALSEQPSFSFDAYFGILGAELEALNLAVMEIKAQDTQRRSANWKIILEGGVEAYHFKMAHKNTIAPYFEDNLSTYHMDGVNMRSVLARTSIGGLKDVEQTEWAIRDHANLLYTFFPTTQFLVQQDHVIWIQATPLSANLTELKLSTLAPKDGDKGQDYWDKNHAITCTTLNEDFDIGESIQANLDSGAATDLLFGRYEGALTAIKKLVEIYSEDVSQEAIWSGRIQQA